MMARTDEPAICLIQKAPLSRDIVRNKQTKQRLVVRWPKQSLLLAMGTPSMPVRRWHGLGPYNNLGGEERLDNEPSFLGGRMHPSKIPDAVRAGRERVLQEVAEENILP